MRRSSWAWALLVLALPIARADDSVALDYNQNENGVIAWGRWADPNDTDEFKTALGYSSVTFPNIDTGGDASQFASFTIGRPPALDAAVPWTSGVDSLSLKYPDAEYPIPVKMWILCANPACKPISAKKKVKLGKDLVWGSERFLAERVGMKLIPSGGDEWITDQVSLGSDATDVLLDFDDARCDKFDQSVKSIKQPDAINIYVVNSVQGSESRGYQCEDNYDSFVVGRKAIRGTVVHEIGHVFGLDHGGTGFPGGKKNFMSKESKTRRWLTEGQVFRMHFHTESGLNNKALSTLLPAGLPPHRDVRNCDGDVDNQPPCPPEETLLWKDK